MDFDRLSGQYHGQTARQYNAERESGTKWRREQDAFGALLKSIPDGVRTLDVPVGTGRLFPFCKGHQFQGTGIDISPDMLREARSRAARLGLTVDLRIGDIRDIPFPDDSFDLAMCVRFLNWVDIDGVRTSFGELVRVSRDWLLVGIRHMTPLSDFRPTLADFTRIVRRSLGHAKARARKSGLVYHRKSDVHEIFGEFRLEIINCIHVEKRSDGTDYYLYLLRKNGDE